MVKIKQKKTMNLPQLIEWAYHQGSDVRDEKIKSESMTITFSEIGTPHIETKFHFLQVDELFTVEVEEEITEDTMIPSIVAFYENSNFIDNFKLKYNRSINSFEFDRYDVAIAFYILNDDKSLTLIWTREKGLV